MRRVAASALIAALVATGAAAQTDDRDYLTAFLEDSLSGARRTVTITGFEGALTSQATIARIEIADAGGVWITLEDIVLDWSRSSLLSGEVVVNELTAATITLSRLPEAGEEPGIAPEAGTFALPELPVSIGIGEIAADRIVLGEAVLGEALEGRLEASLTLAGGEGEAALLLERTDEGPAARIALSAGYANATGQLTLDLDAREAAGGIVAALLDLPGRPATALTLRGAGTLADFAADFVLESDGVERLAGPVTLTAEEAGATGFAVQLAGNPAPLFLPDYADFLGDRVEIAATGRRWPSGRVRLDGITLSARALSLGGVVDVAGDGLPERLDLTATIGLADGSPVLLPFPGLTDTRLGQARLLLRHDAARDSEWSAVVDLSGLERPGLRVEGASLRGSGRIDRVAGRAGIGGTLDFALRGLGGLDPAVLTALGTELQGRAVFGWREGKDALGLPQIAVSGPGLAAEGALQVGGLSAALAVSGRLGLKIDDLARLSGLVGRELGGRANLVLTGEASPLTGAFDLALDLQGQGLRLGQAEIDRLLAGSASVSAAVRRDGTGTVLRSLEATAASLRLSAEGRLATAGSALTASLDWGSLADLGGGLGGALVAGAEFTGTPEDGRLRLTGNGRDLRIGQAEIDRLVAGQVALDLGLRLTGGDAVLDSLRLTGPNLTAEATARDGRLDVAGRLRDLAILVPGFPGAVTLGGQLTPDGAGWRGDLRVQGPAAIDTRLSGRFDGTRPDLTISGTANAVVANALVDPATLAGALRYDLRLAGSWALSALSGRVTLADGRLALPARGLSLSDLALVADIAAGQARLAATAAAAQGGRLRVEGPVALAAPFEARLAVQLDRLSLRDPELYETAVDGFLSLEGPLAGRAMLSGVLTLAETELRVPSTGFATAADLAAVRHVGDAADVRATRLRAGVGTGQATGGGSAAAGGPDWRLDLLVQAPNRIFLRGRGLDAELGGEIRLGGSLRAVVPSGRLALIRGRLDILGKRLDLTEASLSLEGSLVPFLRVAASNTAEEVTSTVTIEGPADAPEVTFSSVPELPQEEVLAWLLFGRGLQTLSALQAAQLANAIAVLAGRGGEGIVGRLRQGFGLDDLDFGTDADGTATLRAGKYISENVYTELGVGTDGTSRINLNLDLAPGVTVRGRVDSDGESGIGIFLEKDY